MMITILTWWYLHSFLSCLFFRVSHDNFFYLVLIRHLFISTDSTLLFLVGSLITTTAAECYCQDRHGKIME